MKNKEKAVQPTIHDVFNEWLNERTVFSAVLVASGYSVYTFYEDADFLVENGYDYSIRDNMQFVEFPLTALKSAFDIYTKKDQAVLCHLFIQDVLEDDCDV
jgi:hypothetical protein